MTTGKGWLPDRITTGKGWLLGKYGYQKKWLQGRQKSVAMFHCISLKHLVQHYIFHVSLLLKSLSTNKIKSQWCPQRIYTPTPDVIQTMTEWIFQQFHFLYHFLLFILHTASNKEIHIPWKHVWYIHPLRCWENGKTICHPCPRTPPIPSPRKTS